MKLRILSDIHLECISGQWEPSILPDEKDTILILAGDIWNGLKPFLWAEGQSNEIRWMDTMSRRFNQ